MAGCTYTGNASLAMGATLLLIVDVRYLHQPELRRDVIPLAPPKAHDSR